VQCFANSAFRPKLIERCWKPSFTNRRFLQSQQELHVPVLIVGAGPVGTYLSILLSNYGIESAIVERSARGGDTNDDGYAHPRAHVLNTRTMEILRSIGLESAVRAEMPPQDQWRYFR
jgi:2-polyprenyl-6-methoxyphenol hydroxylase-like FAD-dependent oxidoreductase